MSVLYTAGYTKNPDYNSLIKLWKRMGHSATRETLEDLRILSEESPEKFKEYYNQWGYASDTYGGKSKTQDIARNFDTIREQYDFNKAREEQGLEPLEIKSLDWDPGKYDDTGNEALNAWYQENGYVPKGMQVYDFTGFRDEYAEKKANRAAQARKHLPEEEYMRNPLEKLGGLEAEATDIVKQQKPSEEEQYWINNDPRFKELYIKNNMMNPALQQYLVPLVLEDAIVSPEEYVRAMENQDTDMVTAFKKQLAHSQRAPDFSPEQEYRLFKASEKWRDMPAELKAMISFTQGVSDSLASPVPFIGNAAELAQQNEAKKFGPNADAAKSLLMMRRALKEQSADAYKWGELASMLVPVYGLETTVIKGVPKKFRLANEAEKALGRQAQKIIDELNEADMAKYVDPFTKAGTKAAAADAVKLRSVPIKSKFADNGDINLMEKEGKPEVKVEDIIKPNGGKTLGTSGGKVPEGSRETGKIPWDSWQNYKKVTANGQEYAKVGDKLYSRHAVDRMQPSGKRFTVGDAIVQAGGVSGRSVAPQFVEDVITSVKPVFQPATGNYIYSSGTVKIVTNEYGHVVTIMTVG